jgi:protein-tyrosine phosphatase
MFPQRMTTRLPGRSLAMTLCVMLLVLTACASAPDHTKRLAVSGTRNLRDIGGYQTSGALFVKHGQVYRSDQLTNLGRDGLQQVAKLGLKRVYDLRNEQEKKDDAYHLDYQGAPQIIPLPVYHQSQDPALMRSKILSGKVEEGEFQQLMIDTYRTLALDYCPVWAALLRGLSDPDQLPALVHCIHGKDRTGFAIALVLLSLGVPQETVMEDYLVSNQFLSTRAGWYSLLAHIASFFRTPRDEVRALLEVKPAYLEAAIDAIDRHYGNLDNYLKECLQIDGETLARLRQILLEVSN